MNPGKPLLQYPEFYSWYQRHCSEEPSDHVELAMTNLARALQSNGERMVALWCQGLRLLVEKSPAPYDSYCRFEERLSGLGVSYPDIATEIGHLSFDLGLSSLLLETATLAANRTHVVTFRFLAAWTAFNANMLERCIEECEMVDQPYAAIYGLYGQALLESRQFKESIDVLKIATELAPLDLVLSFQLAKAYFVTDQYNECWNVLETAKQNAPGHEEIVLLQAMAAAHLDDLAKIGRSWNETLALVSKFPKNEEVITLMIEFAFKMEDKEKMSWIMSVVPLDSIRSTRAMMGALPRFLRHLDEPIWRDVKCEFLTSLTSDLSRNEPQAE